MKLFAVALLLALVACQVPAPSYVKPTDAADSTFRIDIGSLVDGPLGSGTAWVLGNRDGHSVLITARHVCTGDTYSLVAPDGSTHDAHVIRVSEKYDLCALEADEEVGPGLSIAPQGPSMYQHVAYVGAPLGVYGCGDQYSGEQCGYQPMYEGVYAGADLITAPAYGGSSGSAVFTDFGVIGVLVAGYRQFPHLVMIEPRDHLQEFVATL